MNRAGSFLPGHAGISLPAQIVATAGTQSRAFLNDSPSDPESANWYDFDVSGLSGAQLSVDVSRGGVWFFMDEVEVTGSPTPEPGTYAAVLVGIAALGLIRRLRDRFTM